MANLDIPPLPPFQPQWPDFQVWWQLTRQAIQQANSDLSDQVAAIAAAQAAADAATVDAATAQTTADTVTLNDAISVSYTAPGDILSASDAGTDATITIADHTRIYGDQLTVAVTGGTVTGLAYTTDYFVYYDQISRAGGTVTYQASDDANDALPNAAQGRHFLGKVTTPASGGGATTGGSAPPSGGGAVDKGDVHSKL